MYADYILQELFRGFLLAVLMTFLYAVFAVLMMFHDTYVRFFTPVPPYPTDSELIHVPSQFRDVPTGKLVLFHGTSVEAASGIFKNNFFVAQGDQVENGARYGEGLYLTEQKKVAEIYGSKYGKTDCVIFEVEVDFSKLKTMRLLRNESWEWRTWGATHDAALITLRDCTYYIIRDPNNVKINTYTTRCEPEVFFHVNDHMANYEVAPGMEMLVRQYDIMQLRSGLQILKRQSDFKGRPREMSPSR